MKHALLAICICPVALGCGHTLQVNEPGPTPEHFRRTGAEIAKGMTAPGSRPDADGALRSSSGNGYLAWIRSNIPFNPASDASIRRHFRLLRAVATRPVAVERLATVERTRVARLLVEHVEARRPIVDPFLEGVATWNLPAFLLGAGGALHEWGCYDALLKMVQDPSADETTRGAASFLLGLCAAVGEAWRRAERSVIDRSEQVESCAAFLEKKMKHPSSEIRLYALCGYSFLVDYLPDANVALRHAERLSKEDPSLLVRMRAMKFLAGLRSWAQKRSFLTVRPGTRPDADGALRTPSGNGYLAWIRSNIPFNPASDASIRRHFRLLRTARQVAIERLAKVEPTRVARLLVEHVEARKPIVAPALEGVAPWNLPVFFLRAGEALHECGCYDVLLKMAEDPSADETTRGAASFLLGLCARAGEEVRRAERPVIDRSEQVESCAAFLEKKMKHSSSEIRLYALCAYSFLVYCLPDASVALRHAERLSKEDPSLLVRMRAIQFLDGLKNLRVRSTERKGQ